MKPKSDSFFWSNKLCIITAWSLFCVPCQLSKDFRFIEATLGQLSSPEIRSYHVHVNLVGLWPISRGFTYILTRLDRFPRWPEAIPLADISAESVVLALVSNWIARFEVQAQSTTDHGQQFEASLFRGLSRMLGIHHIRTTSYNLASNGRFNIFTGSFTRIFWSTVLGRVLAYCVPRLSHYCQVRLRLFFFWTSLWYLPLTS